MQDTWHLSELGHTYLTDILLWLVKTGLEQLCIRPVFANAPQGSVAHLRPSLLEPARAGLSDNSNATESKYKLCAITSGLEPYVVLLDKSWEYNSDGKALPCLVDGSRVWCVHSSLAGMSPGSLHWCESLTTPHDWLLVLLPCATIRTTAWWCWPSTPNTVFLEAYRAPVGPEWEPRWIPGRGHTSSKFSNDSA